MDKIEKDCVIKHPQYRNSIEIPELDFIDDLLDINKCGKHIEDQFNYTKEEIK